MTVSKILNVAIIQLDDDRVPVSDNLNYAEMGEILLNSIDNDNNNNNFKIDIYNYVNNGKLPTIPYDIVYFTGSKYDAFEDNKFNNGLIDYIKSIIKTDCKLLGICYGHQIIARSLGYEIIRSESWEIGNVKVEMETPVLGIDSFIISQIHRDRVKDNDDEIFFGKSDKCNIQGIYIKDKILTFQGHPEFTKDTTTYWANQELKKGGINSEFFNDILKRNKEMREDGMDVNGELKLQKMIKKFLKNV